MDFEQRPPEDEIKSVEFRGKKFEVRELGDLNASDIQLGDRALITTESGNRYMLRRSKSEGGALMVYNERNNFEGGGPIHLQGEKIAEVGKPFNHFVITDPKEKLGNKQETTSVSRIEVRKGIDDAIENAKGEGASFAQMLKDQVRGRRNP